MKYNNRQHIIRMGMAIALLGVLILSLSAASFAPQSAKAAPLAQITRKVSFASATLTVSETAGVISVPVSLDVASTNNMSVSYSTFDGTGTAGVDYINTSGTVSMLAGETSKNILISIVNNSDYVSPNNFFYVRLSNPVSATLGTNSLLQIIITNDDAAPVPTSTPGSTIYVDAYEPNNTLSQSYTVAANQVGGSAQKLCSITFWPLGDVDYFKFRGKPGSVYTIYTLDLSAGLDTYMKVYNTQGVQIGSNDDIDVGSRASKVEITADVNGFYYVHLINQDPSDSTGKTYCLQVDEVLPPPTSTPPPAFPDGADACEYNSTIATACLMGEGETKSLNFIPVYGSEQDTDMFRLWVKPSIKYTCQTLNLSAYADTNIILYDRNGNPFSPWIGNDDRQIGDRSSLVEYWSTYTGWLYIQVGPVNPPLYEEASLHTYELNCVSDPATPTPTPTATVVYYPPTNGGGTGTGGGGTTIVTSTPFTFPTPLPTPTPFDISALLTPNAPPPEVVFQPLPTAVPAAGSGGLLSTVNITAFYDENNDFTPAIEEGINNIAVLLYDNGTGELTAFGYTNEAGMVRFDSVATSGALRIFVPFLNYTQIVTSSTSDILIRVAPAAMPGGNP